jgi:predicted helicase
MRYAYRSLDRQWIISDSRIGDFMRPVFWRAHSHKQVYITTILSHPLGHGPALVASCDVPDRNFFCNRAGATFPLYRDATASTANLLPGLLDLLNKAYKQKITEDDFFAYVYGMLANAAFTDRYAEELATRELRVPITGDAALFAQVRDVGARLLWLHTYGERYVPKGRHRGQVPKGKARCTKAVPGDAANYPEDYQYNEATKTLHVGSGQFAPVAPEVYNFEVSGLKVVQSWLGYRKKEPKGKKSSPLDDIRPEKWTGEFTTELLELLWVLEATIAEYPKQAELLTAVVKKRTLKF